MIKLVDVTSANWESICCLYPGREGSLFVASNAYSIAQSVFEKCWTIKGIEENGVLVGFTMYGYCDELSGFEICRFMIDERFQGKGIGKTALALIIGEMRAAFSCDKIYLSTDPINYQGKHVYESAGFVPTGKTCGEGDDIEEVFVLQMN